MLDDLRDYDKSPMESDYLEGPVYFSSKKFPSFNFTEAKTDNNVNVFFKYLGNYGSSSVCLYRRVYKVRTIDMNNNSICDDDEIKHFIDLFIQLGLEVCIIHEHTHDTMKITSRGEYEYDDSDASYKLCVSSGMILSDIIS